MALPKRYLTEADKVSISKWFRKNLVDPYSLRTATISDPMPAKRGREVVCVAYDERSQSGKYVSLKRTSFTITPEGAAPTWKPEEVAICSTDAITMKPFPELEALTFGVPSRHDRPAPNKSAVGSDR